MVGVAIVVIVVDVCAVFASAANDKSIDDEHDHDNTTAINMMMVKTTAMATGPTTVLPMTMTTKRM